MHNANDQVVLDTHIYRGYSNFLLNTAFISSSLNLNLNSLLVKRQIDNPSPGAVTGGN